jgi:acyl-coenzyme A synthetase/AMP-(fatty) acid ligase
VVVTTSIPAIIEEALLGHDAVAFAGAIGQPDGHAGELPCAYVELVAGANVTVDELIQHCANIITERAAMPKYIEVLSELPKPQWARCSNLICAKARSHGSTTRLWPMRD